jgi:hypothetical protein
MKLTSEDSSTECQLPVVRPMVQRVLLNGTPVAVALQLYEVEDQQARRGSRASSAESKETGDTTRRRTVRTSDSAGPDYAWIAAESALQVESGP